MSIGIARVLLGVLLLLTVGCGGDGLKEYKIRDLLESKPLQLEAEQVVLSMSQIDCGIRSELWEAPIQSGDLQIFRLLEKGRTTRFTDDIILMPSARNPYAQLRGEFSLSLQEVINVKDIKGGKLVEAKLGVYVNNSCLSGPVPMMGVRRGDFHPDAPVQLQFLEQGGWHLDRIVH